LYVVKKDTCYTIQNIARAEEPFRERSQMPETEKLQIKIEQIRVMRMPLQDFSREKRCDGVSQQAT
jgi:hypothetical protein